LKKEKKKDEKKTGVKKVVKDEFGHIKLFNKWDTNVDVKDPGLKNYINLKPRLLPRSAGAHRGRFHKSRMHIVERLALELMVSGHSGRRHRLTSGRFSGKWENVMNAVEKALEIVEKKENKNPLQVLVDAICNAAVREEITSFQVGSVVSREAVITAPQRRVDKTLKFLAQGSYRKTFNKKKTLAQALAEEILAAYEGSNQSYAIQEKDRIEREAAGAR